MVPKRKYSEDYLKFGFTSIEVNGIVKPQCVLCAQVLSNEALKPTKLERHFKSMHPTFTDKPLDYFQGKLANLKKMKLGTSGAGFTANTKSLHHLKYQKLLLRKKNHIPLVKD